MDKGGLVILGLFILIITTTCLLIYTFAFNTVPVSIMATTFLLLATTIILAVQSAIIYSFTPAWDFFLAWMKKDKLDVHVGEDKYLRIRKTKAMGGLYEIKNQGFFQSKSEDTYIESKSKLPISIHYGKMSLSLQPKYAAISKKLKEMGLHNYGDLVFYYNALQDQKKIERGWIEEKADGSRVVHPPQKIKAEDKLTDKINLLGESVNMADVVKYFSSTERSDVTEAEIQRRTAAEVVNKLGANKDVIKWIIVLGVFIICVAIAYVIIVQVTGGSHGTVNNYNILNGSYVPGFNYTSNTNPPTGIIVSNSSLNQSIPQGVLIT
jgi:hypothetical protein